VKTCLNIRKLSYLYKKGRKERISVPVHKNKVLKTGLLKYLMKIAGIKKDEL